MTNGHNRWVLTKSFSWELRFAAMTGETDRIGELDTFLRDYDPDVAQPVAEGWILDDNGTVSMTDPGNQEHASWYLVQLLRSYPSLASRARVIDTRLATTPELTVSMPPRVAAGTAFTVNATLFDTPAAPESATFTASAPNLPAGWTVSTTSAVSGTVRQGDEVPFAWTVTPPPGASGPVTFTLSVTLGAHHVSKRVSTTVGASQA